MDGLTQSYISKRSCKTVSPLISTILSSTSGRNTWSTYWTPYTETLPREHNSKRPTYHQWYAIPTTRALITHSPYILPKYMFLFLPCDVIRSTARFRLLVHTLRCETATWNQRNSLTCDLCDTDNVQNEQHVLFHCANPHMISLHRIYALLFPPTGVHDVFTFFSQNNNKLCFFPMKYVL